MQYQFGSGVILVRPLTNADGSAIAVPTPVKIGALQGGSLDISFNTKTLHGGNQFPLAVGRGTGKISGKASFAQVNGALYNALMFGQTLANGILAVYADSTGAAIPSTPYTITPTPPSSGTWSEDLGVINSNGVPMTRVSSAPATGQYSVSAGVYTFAAADTGQTVFINYRYTATSTTAKKQTVMNLPLGYAPTFELDLSIPYAGKNAIFHLYACTGSKIAIATKMEDFMIPDFEFEAFSDSANRVMDWALSE